MSRARNGSYRRLLHTMRGHEKEINRIAWSPDGRWLASSSFDKTVRIWNTQTGQQIRELQGHSDSVYGVSWSPDGQFLASCSQDKSVLVWSVQTWQPLFVGEHKKSIYNIAWPSTDRYTPSLLLASCSADQRVQIWAVQPMMPSKLADISIMLDLKSLGGHFSEVYDVSCSPKGHIMASSSVGSMVNLWNMEYSELGYMIGALRSHTAAVYSLAWSPNAPFLASGSEDRTIHIWNVGRKYSATGSVTETTWSSFCALEGHTGAITSVSFSHDGRLLASKSRDGLVGLWRTDTWELVDTIETPASNGVFAGLAFHPDQPLLATVSEEDKALQIWQLNIPALLGLEPPQPTTHYVNAKVVLAGESGVGKTALGRALTGQPYIPTDSTHGRFIHNFKGYTVDLTEERQEQREIFLWDLAGQAGSRLVHQLHLPEAAVVLLIFSEMGGDPLTGIRYWGRALRVVQDKQLGGSWPVTKFLVEARIDRDEVRLSREQIASVLREWGLSEYYPTSAKENIGISELTAVIEQTIPWDLLPKVSSTELFQSIKVFLIKRKEAGYVIESVSNLYRAFLEQARLAEEPSNLRAQFETCIGHLDAQGLLRRLSFGELVLLLPEKLDEYAYALVKEVREKADQLGSIAEAEVLAGKFTLPPGVRLQNQEEERIVLLALVQDLITYEIALREEAGGSYLVFPSEVMRQPQASDQQNPLSKTVLFTFEGPVFNIYATLAVRLAYSGFFKKEALWQNCMVFTARAGGICRCELREPKPGEGRGELALFFDAQASEETRYYFEMYVQAHLEKYVGKDKFERQRVFICPKCQMPFSDEQVQLMRGRGRTSMLCVDDGERIDIRDGLERLAHTPDMGIQESMEREADLRKERSVARSVFQGKELTKHHDVYVSYHRQDEQAALRVRESLKEHGYNAWLVDWNSIPGLPRQPQVEETIRQMQAAVVLIGKHEMGRQLELEVAAMMEEFKKRGCPVIPVFLTDAPQNPPIPAFLQNMAEVDFRKQEPDPWERLILGIQNKRV